MTEKPDAFEAELLKVAKHVANKATQETTPFVESVDAFKVLTTYYGLRQKYKASGDDADDEESFDKFAAAMAEQEHGNGAGVRSRSRRSGTT